MEETKCKHRGYWFDIKILFWNKKYLWCDRCRDAIPEKEVFRNADLLHRRNNDGYFMTSKD